MNLSALRRHRRAFTLLELIVVLVVLGLLAAIAIPTYQAVTQRAAETAEKTSLEAVARAATANAAAKRDTPPNIDHFQLAFDETPSFGAYSAGEYAQEAEGANVVVAWTAAEAPEGARVFLYDGPDGTGSDGRTSAIISPATSHTERCVVAAVVGTAVRAAVIIPSNHGDVGDRPIADQCIPAVAMNWANGTNDAVPPAETTTTEPEETTTTTVPDPVAADTPTNLTSVSNTTEIALSWDPVPGDAITYDVAKSGNVETPVADGLTDASWTDTELAEGTSHSYQVRACADLCSDWSEPHAASTATTPAPAAPTAPTVTAVNTSSIALTWTAVDGAASYDVRVNGTVEVTGHTGASITLNSSNMAVFAAGTTYNIAVRACGANGACSAWSSNATTTSGGSVLVSAGANASNTSNWTVPAGVTSVRVLVVSGAGAAGRAYNNGTGDGQWRGTARLGGAGAAIRATLSATPGETIARTAGGGGAATASGNGNRGRLSELRFTADSNNARRVVAGGGGGAGSTFGYTSGAGGRGGAGSGFLAGNGGGIGNGPGGGLALQEGQVWRAHGGTAGANGAAGAVGGAASGQYQANGGTGGAVNGGNAAVVQAQTGFIPQAGAGGDGFGGGGGGAVAMGYFSPFAGGGGGGGGGLAPTAGTSISQLVGLSSSILPGYAGNGYVRICFNGDTTCG